jgi:hypothetical protein
MAIIKRLFNDHQTYVIKTKRHDVAMGVTGLIRLPCRIAYFRSSSSGIVPFLRKTCLPNSQFSALGNSNSVVRAPWLVNSTVTNSMLPSSSFRP